MTFSAPSRPLKLESAGSGALAEQTHEPSRRLPDFFIVGHEKCGTTALYQMMAQHPQIYMSQIKEPRFFASELRSRFRRLGSGKLPLTLDAYETLFAAAGAEQCVGEASPSYLRSRAAASRIGEVQPDARIIAILREPASFLRSFHLQCLHNHVETQKDFGKAIALEDARRRGRRIPRFSQSPDALFYSDHVRYVEQLSRYRAAFPDEQILVLIYEDFRRDNAATLRRVLRFLDVDDDVAIEMADTEPLQGVRSLPLLQLGFALSIARRKAAASGGALRTLNARMPTPTSNDAFRAAWRRLVYTKPRGPDDQLMLELRRRFKGDVIALSDYLGRDLVTLWGYDNVD
jgi:Sulfotransferase family